MRIPNYLLFDEHVLFTDVYTYIYFLLSADCMPPNDKSATNFAPLSIVITAPRRHRIKFHRTRVLLLL